MFIRSELEASLPVSSSAEVILLATLVYPKRELLTSLLPWILDTDEILF